MIRRVKFIQPVRERINTPDDDFLDLDWYRQGSPHCIIISHGLEGNTQRSYVLGMARALFHAGNDVLAWNYRGCSGEVNRQLRFYHSGATDDLHTVVLHAKKQYENISLIGFSLGGNLTLKYLGEDLVPAEVKTAVAISVPLNLHTSCLELNKASNWVYSQRFLRSLFEKVKSKPGIRAIIDVSRMKEIKTLMGFDDHFTGPLHGFRDAIDYYTKCSAINFLPKISVNTLIVNAKNDPFLSPDCYPGKNYPHITYEFPERGGHVGFARFQKNGLYWSEMRALSFIDTRKW
jgi:predicted alpha/beta-fold hydrolase